MELLMNPWPWYIAGPILAAVMFSMIWFGKRFGVSSNLVTVCSMAGAGKYADYFDMNWRSKAWNLVFITGAVLGGFITVNFLSGDTSIDLAASTVAELENLGFENIGSSYLPEQIFGSSVLGSGMTLILLMGGGFLVGFGARYAGGCTSGHAISGLSNLQIPSLVSVIGFFIGGLIMVHILFPIIFN